MLEAGTADGPVPMGMSLLQLKFIVEKSSNRKVRHATLELPKVCDQKRILYLYNLIQLIQIAQTSLLKNIYVDLHDLIVYYAFEYPRLPPVFACWCVPKKGPIARAALQAFRKPMGEHMTGYHFAQTLLDGRSGREYTCPYVDHMASTSAKHLECDAVVAYTLASESVFSSQSFSSCESLRNQQTSIRTTGAQLRSYSSNR